MEQQILNSWSVWIDENKKVISIKENSAGKESFFENRDIYMTADGSRYDRGRFYGSFSL